MYNKKGIGGQIRMIKITNEMVNEFEAKLYLDEKSKATVEKYIRDVCAFAREYSSKNDIEKGDVVAYKQKLCERYAPASVNSVISSLASFFDFIGHQELKVKSLKIQRQIFASEEKELRRSEYEKLLFAAKRKNDRLYLLIQTICATGIRVSELRYVTAEAVKTGKIRISNKGKMRSAFIPPELGKLLVSYIRKKGIKTGSVFVTRNGNPLDRSNIWSEMKKLAKRAGVSALKIFPHNLRHLFARTFYSLSRDIVKLADILGHSNINTTRIYTMETGKNHILQLDKLQLVYRN